MARIRSIERGTQNIRVHDSEVDCFHQIVSQNDGTRLVHLSTFGSDQRKSGPKSSQTIQINEHFAEELVKILIEAFPSIAPRQN